MQIDLVRSVGVKTAIQLVSLNRLDGFPLTAKAKTDQKPTQAERSYASHTETLQKEYMYHYEHYFGIMY